MIKCIQNDFKDSTVLIIAHKLVNIMNCDRVLVLDKGKIKEFDSPITLYQTPGSAFKELCDSEKKLFGIFLKSFDLLIFFKHFLFLFNNI